MSIHIEEQPPREGSLFRRFNFSFGTYRGTAIVDPDPLVIVGYVGQGAESPRSLTSLNEAIRDYIRVNEQ